MKDFIQLILLEKFKIMFSKCWEIDEKVTAEEGKDLTTIFKKIYNDNLSDLSCFSDDSNPVVSIKELHAKSFETMKIPVHEIVGGRTKRIFKVKVNVSSPIKLSF